MNIKKENIKSEGIKFQVLINDKEIGRAFLYLLKNDQHKRPFGFVEDVYIDPEFQGQGIGSKLMEEIIKEAKIQCYKLILTSRHSKPQVHALYKKLGFKDWGCEFRMNF